MSDMFVNYGARARIGVLLPSGNMAAEPELTAMMPEGVACHITRLPLKGSSREDLLGMTTHVESAASLLKDMQPRLLVFHCTAVSTWDTSMDDSLCERIQTATGIRAITTAKAIVEALRHVGGKRIVLLTPYIEEINTREVAYLCQHGIDVAEYHGLGLHAPDEMMAIEPESWLEFALKHRDDSADAYLISCAAIRTLGVIDAMEKVLGRPVITSNQAMVWHALRVSAIDDSVHGAGSLLLRPGK
ncbi:maleate isomerase [Paraburkholderia sp. RAU6.4a]|uniref:maleate cis-trans isomerase family protein n=1 Tax=Paraburkholderia sp. RAU6.4a TaxID=2991067 RepID=UPI003D1A3E0A